MILPRRWFRALDWLAPVLVILVTGCATLRPTISTWRDSPSAPGRADTLALITHRNPSPETAELGRLLTAELKREGFDLVPVGQADYLVAYTLEDELVDQGRSTTTVVPPSPPQSSAQVVGHSAYGGTGSTIPAQAVSQPVVYRNRGIRLFLYSNPKTHPEGFRIVWQGYITAGQTSSAEGETALIKALLDHWGQEYHGPATLAK